MKISSAKNKGRRLQQYVVSKLLEVFPEFTDKDIRSTPMGVSGDDIQLSESASEKINLSIECKNKEKINIWEALEQSDSDNRELTPIVVFKRNRSEVYCALKFEDFLKYLKHE